MSFTLVGPWAFGGKLTSSQANQLDSDHVNALDKSSAGDTLSGLVAIGTGGTLSGNVALAFLATVADAFHATAGGAVRATVNDGIQANVFHGITAGIFGGISDGGAVGGISPSVAGGIGDGGIAGGIAPTVAGGISDGGIAGGIRASVVGGITANTAGGITSGVLNGIRLTGGATDQVQFATAHTTIRRQLLWSPKPAGAWTQQDQELVGPNTTAQTFVPLLVLDDLNSSGATLTNVKLRFVVNDPHAGGVPAVMPQFGLVRALVATGSTYATQSLTSFTPQIPAPGSGAAWYSSNHIQEYSFVPDQNNVIDRNLYVYYLILEDENGANSVAGNSWFSVELTLTGITSTSR